MVDGQQQVKSEEFPVEMGLNAVDVTVGKALSVEVDFDAFYGTLDTGAHTVPGAVPDGMLGMVPVDLRKVPTGNPDVPALAFSQAASR